MPWKEPALEDECEYPGKGLLAALLSALFHLNHSVRHQLGHRSFKQFPKNPPGPRWDEEEFTGAGEGAEGQGRTPGFLIAEPSSAWTHLSSSQIH